MDENNPVNQGPQAVQPKGAEPPVATQTGASARKPTYQDESQLQPAPKEQVFSKDSKSKIVFWMGIGALLIALIAAGLHFLIQG